MESELGSACMEDALKLGLSSWRVRQEKPLEVEGSFSFPEESVVFAGHFPENPLLPAFLQLAMVRLLGQRALSVELRPFNTARIKFSGFVRPGESVVVVIRLVSDSEDWLVDFSMGKGKKKVASGGMRFTTVHGE